MLFEFSLNSKQIISFEYFPCIFCSSMMFALTLPKFSLNFSPFPPTISFNILWFIFFKIKFKKKLTPEHLFSTIFLLIRLLRNFFNVLQMYGIKNSTQNFYFQKNFCSAHATIKFNIDRLDNGSIDLVSTYGPVHICAVERSHCGKVSNNVLF